jgi:hypothetical protein
MSEESTQEVVKVAESKLKELLRSRKFWAAVLGLVVVILKIIWPAVGNDKEVAMIVGLLMTYMGATGAVDVAKVLKNA